MLVALLRQWCYGLGMTTTTAPAALKSVDDINVGDAVVVPGWVGNRMEYLRCTVTGTIEYPENRVFYFAEGSYGVYDRRAFLADADLLVALAHHPA